MKYGIRPMDFVNLEDNEKATIIAFIRQHAKDEKDAADDAKRGR